MFGLVLSFLFLQSERVREVVATLLVCFFLGWGEFVEFKGLSGFQGFKRGKKPIKIEFCWRYMYLPT